MPRLTVKITGHYHERFGDTHRFRVRGNGILFEQICHNKDLSPEKLTEINENFKNSLRVVKHTGGYFPDDATEAGKKEIINRLTVTDTGIGIKIKDDPLKEFIPFKL